MKILVTGGAGFIGFHACRAMLRRGWEVCIVDNLNDQYNVAQKEKNLKDLAEEFGAAIDFKRSDITDRDVCGGLFASNAFDAVVHLAARAGVRPSLEAPSLYVDVNIHGTLNLLEASRRAGVTRWVLASSSSVYGTNAQVPFKEEDALSNVISPYAATKLACEALCHSYSVNYGISMVALRFFTVYGPRQRPDLAISTFTRRILEDKPIDVFGDGNTSRDYTYCDDIASGIVQSLLVDVKTCEVINLGGNRPVRLRELISIIERSCGKRANINRLPMQMGDVPVTCANIDKAMALLNYNPKTSLEAGIGKFIEWFKAQ